MPACAQSLSALDFSRHAEISDISMSPDGRYVALAVPSADGMETQLHVVPLDGSGKVQAMRFGRQQHVTGIVWSDNDQVVVSRAKMEPLKARPYRDATGIPNQRVTPKVRIETRQMKGRNQRWCVVPFNSSAGDQMMGEPEPVTSCLTRRTAR